ncbi:helix-turn-helix domain-containing protein [Desulfovibrio sp.]|uniref:helix-turn-helix domain-containing protein n=1 Tax=Desulfovibrio sp. TaxID=885 RepID=UPI003D0D3909
MICPRHDPRAPLYTCWQRIPDITDRLEIVRCQQCPHGRALIATVKRQPDADQDMPGAVEALPQEEIIMEAQTYTVPKLAELLGVEARHIYNARASKGIPSAGSMKRVVLDGMRKRGITWDKVVPAPKGGGRKASGAPSPDDGQVETDGSATAAEAPQAVPAIQEMPDALPAARRENICERWPLDVLIKAVRAKLPAHTSITINS